MIAALARARPLAPLPRAVEASAWALVVLVIALGVALPEQADSAIAVRWLWENEPNLLRGWMEGIHARTLADRGFGEDVGYCAAIDTLPHVPTLITGAETNLASAPVILIG